MDAAMHAGPAAPGRSRQPPYIKALRRDGYVIAENLVATEAIASIAAELEPWFEATPRCQGDFYGWKTTRVGSLLSKARGVRDLVLHPDILAIVTPLLQPGCDVIQLNLAQAVRVHAGERAQVPHRDEEMWPHEPKLTPWLINVMWPLSAFTEANGATRIWPRSHVHQLDRNVDPLASIAAEMAPSSALIYLGSVTHGAGANITSEPRSGIIVSYCLGWLKQYENQFLAYSPETVRTFSPELQRLIGYQVHRPNLGGWDGQDPIYALDPERERGPHTDALPGAIAQQLKHHYGEDR